MGPSVNGTANTVTPPDQSHGADTLIKEFQTLVSRLCSNKGFQSLNATYEENERLKKDLDKKNIAYEQNLKTMNEWAAKHKAESEALEKKVQEQLKEQKNTIDEKEAAERKLAEEKKNVAALQSKNKLLDEDVKRQIKTIQEHEVRAGKAQAENKQLQQQLKKLKDAKEKLETDLESAKRGLDTKSKALEDAWRDLREILFFVETMEPLEKVRARISQTLGYSFEEASRLFEEFLGRDLDPERLGNLQFWDRMRKHHLLEHEIPLPTTNSLPAKRMRTAVGLLIYSNALRVHIFRPTFLSGEGNGAQLDKTLEAVLRESPEQDQFVRAVLLKVLPKQQMKHQARCVEHVVDDVARELSGCLPAADRAKEVFRERLRDLTTVVSDNWYVVQRLATRIQPTFDPVDAGDWRRIPALPASTDTKPPSPPLSPPSGGKQQQGQGRHGGGGGGGNQVSAKQQQQQQQQQKHQQQKQQQQQQQQEPELSESEIIKAIWPAFFVPSPGGDNSKDDGSDEDLIHHGYVLTQADVQAAQSEYTQERRKLRQKARENQATGQKKRRNSAAFFMNDSDGSDVK